MKRAIANVALALSAGCSESHNREMAAPQEQRAFDVVQPPGIVANSPPPPDATRATAQIAYTYGVGYTLSDGDVAPVQARHVALCARLGGARCRIGGTKLTSNDGAAGSTSGRAIFLVDAQLARGFIARLDAASTAAGGHATDRTVEAEDVTKQLIDTEARVRAKQALAERLLKLIQSADAKVGELVEAERAFADTQEELDAARQLQAALRQRIAMSEVTVDYTSTEASGTFVPIAQSLRATGATLSSSVAALVTFLVAALPWALLLALLAWIGRRRGWRLRWPWRRRADAPPA